MLTAFRILSLFSALLALPSLALEKKGVFHQGDLWSGVIEVTGDVTIPVGKTLTIQAGTQVLVSNTDFMGSGHDPGKVELIINGTLIVDGTQASPVDFKGAPNSTWYGVVGESGSSLTVTYANFSKALLPIDAKSNTTVKLSNLNISEAKQGVALGNGGTVSDLNIYYVLQTGLFVGGGTANISTSVFTECENAVEISGGVANISGTQIYRNRKDGIQLFMGAANVNTSTIVFNGRDGIDQYGGTLTLVSSIITNNTGKGVARNGGTSSISHSNFWLNSSGNFCNSDCIEANPLFLDPVNDNFRITSRSPSRNSGVNGVDQGWAPFRSTDISPFMAGVLFSGETWSGTIHLVGDVTVPAGQTLTIQAGTQVIVSDKDIMVQGTRDDLVELIVHGTLQVEGTSANPVVFKGDPNTLWYGIHAMEGSLLTVNSTNFSNATDPISTQKNTNVSLSNVNMTGGRLASEPSGFSCYSGVAVYGGVTTVSSLSITGCYRAVLVQEGVADISYALLKENGEGVFVYSGTAKLDHSTIVMNSHNGIHLSDGSLNLTNSIVSGNASYGIKRVNGTADLSYSNIWNNSSGEVSGVLYFPTCISANPLFVAPTNNNFRLQSNSPCIGSGINGTDMGAFPFTGAPVASVTLAPSLSQVAVGETVNFTAQALDASGNPVSNVNYVWSVQGGGIVTSSGSYKAPCTPGTATLKVEVVGTSISATRALNITQGVPANVTIASIAVTPISSTVISGGTQAFSATAKDNCNQLVPATFTWATTVPGATISNAGLFTAGNTGGTYATGVTASCAGISGSASVTVQASPPQVGSLSLSETQKTLKINESHQFVATVKDTNGNVMTGQSVQFTVVHGGGSISPSGLFTAGTVANVFNNTLKATSGSVSATASITVLPGPVARVEVLPNQVELAPRSTQIFSAVQKDSAGNITAEPLTWDVTDAAAGSITSNGQFTASATIGTYVNAVRATTASNIQGFASVTLKPAALSQLNISPTTATLTPGGVETFTVTAVDATGATVTTVTPIFSIEAGGGAIDANSGRFVAGTVAKAYPQTVKVTASGLAAFATVVIQPGPVSDIDVTPQSATLPPFGITTFAAKPKDAYGNAVSANVSWNALLDAGNVTPGGVFTASNKIGNYPNAVTATVGNVTQSASLTILPGAAAQIEIQPASPRVPIGSSLSFTAVVKDAGGNPLPAAATFSIEAGGGSMTPAGLFTAGTSAGLFSQTVKASYQGISSFTSVTVEPGPVASIDLTPSSVRLAPGGTTTFTAQPKDAYNNPLSVSVGYSVTPEAGTITANGFFRAANGAGNFPGAVKSSIGTISASATVVIDPSAPSKLVLTPTQITLEAGNTYAFGAKGFDEFGNEVEVTPRYTVVKGGGNIQSTTGVFTAGTTPGVYVNTIRVEADGLTAFATVNVKPGAWAVIEVKPGVVALKQGQQQTFEAVVKDEFGNVISDAPKVKWTALPAAGSITSEGVFTASMNSGDYPRAIIAQLEALEGSAQVKVLSMGSNTTDGGTETTFEPLEDTQGRTSAGCGSCQSVDGTLCTAIGVLWAWGRRRKQR